MITPTSYNNTIVDNSSPPGYWGHPTASGMLKRNRHVQQEFLLVSLSFSKLPCFALLFPVHIVGKSTYLSVGVLDGTIL